MVLALRCAGYRAVNSRRQGDATMATTARATLRRSDRFGLCTLAVLTMLALIGNGASPALALSRTGVVVPGTGVKVAPPDPCLPQPTVNFDSTRWPGTRQSFAGFLLT